MPEHQINVGDVVLVSRKHPLKDAVEGAVFEKGKNFITVLLGQKLPPSKSYRIDLYVNDITFKRMIGTLELFEKGYSLFDDEVVLGHKNPDFRSENINFEPFNKKLNKFQLEAVEKALKAEELFLIHGPPGTGKTTTLAEVIYQHTKKGLKCLATADSNTAVDNIAEKLLNMNLKIVRIGHPARLRPELLDQSLDKKITEHKDYVKIKQINNQIEKLRDKQENYIKPTAQRRRGLTYEEIIKYAKEGKKVRGYKVEKLQSMAKWIEIQKEIVSLAKERDKIQESIIKDIIENAQVVLSTNTGSQSDFLKDYTFDCIFVDEAAQATEPSCLMPLIKGKKVVMAGDHKQLPPTILNPEAKALSFTMFERFTKLYPEVVYMLKIQYRMNEKIMLFSSINFYNGQLIADESVKNIKLSDLTGKTGKTPISNDTPVVFIDTEGKFLEKEKKGSKSKYNPKEGKLVKKAIDELKEIGINPKDIGVITPYKDHEDYLKKLINDVEIKTVDGFQGREKEIIIISLVRSNPNEEIGFLDDERRLNVAITRAKRKLIVIGDANTLKSTSIYGRLIKYISENGEYVKISDLNYTF